MIRFVATPSLCSITDQELLKGTGIVSSKAISTSRHGKGRLTKYRRKIKVYLLLGTISSGQIRNFDSLCHNV